jgi:hypothetical protein
MLVSFDIDKKYILFLLITPILIYIETMILEINDILNIYYIIDGLSFSVLLPVYFVEKIISSRIHTKQIERFFTEDKKKVFKYKYFRLILLIICCISLNEIMIKVSLFCYDEIVSLSEYFPLIFYFINDRIIFKHHFYSHQILSLIIVFIINLISIFLLINKINNFTIFLIYNIIHGYSYSLSYLLVKYINTTYDISIYLIMFLFGISQLIFSLSDFKIFIEVFKKYYLQCSLFFIDYIFYNFIGFYIIQKYGPIHSKICILFSLTGYWVWKGKFDIFIILILILTIIASMIYLEIIQLNFCGFNKNVKKNIIKRGENEINNISMLEQSINSNIFENK